MHAWGCHEAVDRLRELTGRMVYPTLRWGLPHNLNFREACITLANEYFDRPDDVREMLRHFNWRCRVIANTVIVLNRDSRFEQDYVDVLTGRRFVYPDAIGIGWLVVKTEKTVPQMETFLIGISNTLAYNEIEDRAENILSIYAALSVLSSDAAKSFEASPMFTALKANNYLPEKLVEGTRVRFSEYMYYFSSRGSIE